MPTMSEQAEGARGQLPSPVPAAQHRGCVSLLPGEDRISAAVLLPLLSCLHKAPASESGLARLPFVPGSLPPGAHAALGACGAPWAAVHTRGCFNAWLDTLRTL